MYKHHHQVQLIERKSRTLTLSVPIIYCSFQTLQTISNKRIELMKDLASRPTLMLLV